MEKPSAAALVVLTALASACQTNNQPDASVDSCDPYTDPALSPDAVEFCEELAQADDVRETVDNIFVSDRYRRGRLGTSRTQQTDVSRITCDYSIPVMADYSYDLSDTHSMGPDDTPVTPQEIKKQHEREWVVDIARRAVASITVFNTGMGTGNGSIVAIDGVSEYQGNGIAERPNGVVDHLDQWCKVAERERVQADYAARMRQGRDVQRRTAR